MDVLVICKNQVIKGAYDDSGLLTRTLRENDMGDTKACPLCGEQILAVAVKCKHCGSMLDNQSAPSAPSIEVKSQFKMRPGFVVALLAIVGLFAIGWAYNWSKTGSITGRGFSDDDVAKIEQSIRENFEKRGGVTVEEVQMIRVEPRRLQGFAKLKLPLIGAVSRTCTATMGEDGRSIWQCGN